MSDDPSLNFIASQKSITDAQAARGHDQHPLQPTYGIDGVGTGSATGGVIGTILYIVFEIGRAVIPFLFRFALEILKGLFWLIGAMLSRRR